MHKLSIIIACAPYHQSIVGDAIASVRAQTVPCDVIVIYDEHARGAGWARNQGIGQSRTEYVAFLDADDILDPHFAESCLKAITHYAQSHADIRYAYTDWLGDENKPIVAPLPCIAWTERTSHLVTAVVPTDQARLIGGFDENMSGLEDADFYLRLRLSGVCGLHVHSPSNLLESALVSYREGGRRSIQARVSGQEGLIQQYMLNRYGDYNLMGCCGDNTKTPITPANEPQDGFVLVQAQWHGNRVERGRATGNLYPRTSYPGILYVAESDAAAAPQHWKRVNSAVQASNGVILQPAYQSNTDPWQDIANAIMTSTVPQESDAPTMIEYKPNKTGRSKADTIKGMQG